MWLAAQCSYQVIKSVGGNSTVGSRGSVSTHTDYNLKTASQAGRLEKQELEIQGSSTSSYPHQFVHNVRLGDQPLKEDTT